MRIIHLLVIGALIFAAAYVYRIKMESSGRPLNFTAVEMNFNVFARYEAFPKIKFYNPINTFLYGNLSINLP